MSFQDTPSSVAPDAVFLSVFQSLLAQVAATRPTAVRMILGGEVLTVSFVSVVEGEQSPVEVPAIDSTQYAAWLSFLLDRTYYWPDFGDALFASNQNSTKRILFSADKESLLADFVVVRTPGRGVSEIHFANIKLEAVEPLAKNLLLSTVNERFLNEIISAPSGVVLASSSTKPHVVDGIAVVLAMHPNATVVRHCASEKTAGEILEQAKKQLVVVGMKGEDPIDMIAQFNGLLSRKPAAASEFVQLLRGTFVHFRVRRVCAGCARSTPVDSRTIDKVPIQLRALVKSSYMFGRGCDACGHSAYRGTVGLSSVLSADQGFREILNTSPRSADLALDAYNSGVRTVFEDGLEKIFAGLVSFEEVFSVTTNISAAFAGAIAAFRDGVQQTGIEALESGSFHSPTAESKPLPQGKRRVLVVEDDSDQRNVLESVFRTEGFEVYGAENGKAALQSLEAQPVDIVICDVMMPVMNGAQFVKELRGSPKLKHVPVLMLTAVSNPDAECKLLSHGADDYCEKNVKRKVLLTRVEKLLQRNLKNPLQHMLKD